MPTVSRVLGCVFLLTAASACIAVAQGSPPTCSRCAEWNQPQEPFRIFGNTYYVGPHGLTSLLITSKAGHILIDGALPQSAPQIAAHIRSLGFRLKDVKIILNSHVHFDHAGGIAELQRRSGARVIASPWSAAVMKSGGIGHGDPQLGILLGIAPVKKVSQLADGESFSVGDIVITAHLTPGHTPGGTSWTWKSCEGTVCREMVYADSLSAISADRFQFTSSRDFPNGMNDFEKSFAFLATAPCDILMTTHPEASGMWDRLQARDVGQRRDAFVDPAACRQLAERGREQLRQRIEAERKP